ncbi:branched-chain amino acid transport system II carrier protein [Sporosarcina sp. P12(2017)]|uniref:branched-chain amino acid transport system II carrier protein n=1 Tax=unclassified Sporosarcina TaxID=2647733 RepID=UPI000C169DDF|nr:branched-chain amino acid transport system II carrier protein [Sporosarcina sp. P10]PIC59542.1 branched-chain amino acid transport system II carrier protein [Sporosarcina sp. P12(2017)]
MNQFTKFDTFKLGLTMFALFFGAGNMIFPPLLGQLAGTQTWITLVGFLITGVGLPYLGVIAVTMSGSQLSDLARKASPLFAMIFPLVIYLALGPFFGVPRTATVSYEIAVSPFVPESYSRLALALFSIVFFTVTIWLSFKPNKIVDRFGSILTPILLAIVTLIVVTGIIKPVGEAGAPQGSYAKDYFFKGFIEGYGTMDAMAALVFAIIVINAVKAKGITDRKAITSITMKAGSIAVIGLSFVYAGLAYLGMTSRSVAEGATNGGDILAKLAYALMGNNGLYLLGLAVTLACLTTSVGLTTASATYLSKVVPKISYKAFVFIICSFSTIVANVGLTQLLAVTIPVLVGVYPLAIVLIIFRLLHPLFKGYQEVYKYGLLAAGLIGFFDVLRAFNIDVVPVTHILEFLPLYEQGVGWILPAIVFGAVGFIVASAQGKPRVE